jgi:hypothetical protein
MSNIGFKAYSKQGNMVAETPRKAAMKFFAAFPTARKCDVIQGKNEGDFFVVSYGRISEGNWPASYKDITKKTLDTLPDE